MMPDFTAHLDVLALGVIGWLLLVAGLVGESYQNKKEKK